MFNSTKMEKNAFDTWAFMESVERVFVSDSGVEVIAAKSTINDKGEHETAEERNVTNMKSKT